MYTNQNGFDTYVTSLDAPSDAPIDPDTYAEVIMPDGLLGMPALRLPTGDYIAWDTDKQTVYQFRVEGNQYTALATASLATMPPIAACLAMQALIDYPIV